MRTASTCRLTRNQNSKCLTKLGINNKVKPLCFGYPVKVCARLFALLSRASLPKLSPKLSLHRDWLYIVKKCSRGREQSLKPVCSSRTRSGRYMITGRP